MPKKRDTRADLPAVVWDELRASASEQQRPIHPNIHKSLIHAVTNKNCVTLVMHGHEVSGEPHIYGERGGRATVLLYNEETDPKWTLAYASEVEQVKIWLDEHFNKRELPAEYNPDRYTH
jgi:hypothetical protein